MARRLSPDEYAKIRAGVDDGKIPVGSDPHLAIIQFEMNLKGLSKRDRKIIGLSIRGWTQASIADHIGLSRTTVGYIVRDFFGR